MWASQEDAESAACGQWPWEGPAAEEQCDIVLEPDVGNISASCTDMLVGCFGGVSRMLRGRTCPRVAGPVHDMWDASLRADLASAISGGQWPQARKAAVPSFGITDPNCQLCHACPGTLAHRFECSATLPLSRGWGAIVLALELLTDVSLILCLSEPDAGRTLRGGRYGGSEAHAACLRMIRCLARADFPDMLAPRAVLRVPVRVEVCMADVQSACHGFAQRGNASVWAAMSSTPCSTNFASYQLCRSPETCTRADTLKGL